MIPRTCLVCMIRAMEFITALLQRMLVEPLETVGVLREARAAELLWLQVPVTTTLWGY